MRRPQSQLGPDKPYEVWVPYSNLAVFIPDAKSNPLPGPWVLTVEVTKWLMDHMRQRTDASWGCRHYMEKNRSNHNVFVGQIFHFQDPEMAMLFKLTWTGL